jgi:hypothetical protein
MYSYIVENKVPSFVLHVNNTKRKKTYHQNRIEERPQQGIPKNNQFILNVNDNTTYKASGSSYHYVEGDCGGLEDWNSSEGSNVFTTDELSSYIEQCFEGVQDAPTSDREETLNRQSDENKDRIL